MGSELGLGGVAVLCSAQNALRPDYDTGAVSLSASLSSLHTRLALLHG